MEQVKRFELVELLIPANTLGKATFQTIPQLRNQTDQIIYIKSISVYPITSYANSQQTQALPGMPAADVPKAVLVLYVEGEESIYRIPIAQLIHVNDFATPYQEQLFEFDKIANVDFDKSYVLFSTPSDAADYVIPFGINYVRLLKSASGMPLTTNTPGGNWFPG